MLGKLRENVFLYYTFLTEIPLAWENILDFFFLQANLLSQWQVINSETFFS